VARALLVHLLLVAWRRGDRSPGRPRCYRRLPFARLNRNVRSLELIILRACEQALNEGLQLLGWQRRDPHEPGVQTLKLRFAHRVEVDAMHALVSARPLQPTEKNLGCARVGDRPLTQTALDFGITRRLTVTTRRAGTRVPRCSYLFAGDGGAIRKASRAYYAQRGPRSAPAASRLLRRVRGGGLPLEQRAPRSSEIMGLRAARGTLSRARGCRSRA
jgi:hypothetical protein